MITQVEFIRKHPLHAIRLGDEQYREAQREAQYREHHVFMGRLYSLIEVVVSRGRGTHVGDASELSKSKQKSSRLGSKHHGKDKKLVLLETKILENTIIK